MNLLWQLIARAITGNPRVVDWLIRRAQRTPYTHLTSADGNSLYMGRWWLFNPYGRGADGEQASARIPWLPSVRIHHICRADQDRDLHDHPWNARTIILRGWYEEEHFQPLWQDATKRELFLQKQPDAALLLTTRSQRIPGYTGRLLFGQYHRIAAVSPGGVWTIFITGRKRGAWGFLVNGKKVPWRTYLGLDQAQQTTPSSN